MASLFQRGAGTANGVPGTWWQLLSSWTSPIEGAPRRQESWALLSAQTHLIISASLKSSLQAITGQQFFNTTMGSSGEEILFLQGCCWHFWQTSRKQSNKSNFLRLQSNFCPTCQVFLWLPEKALWGKLLWFAGLGYNSFSYKSSNPTLTERRRKRGDEKGKGRGWGKGGGGGDIGSCNRYALWVNLIGLRNNWI